MANRPQQRTESHPLGNRPRDADGRPSGLADDHPAVVLWQKTQRKKLADKSAQKPVEKGGTN